MANLTPSPGITASQTVTLTNKTIDGDDNTLQDLAPAVIKTNVANANKVWGYDGSGVGGAQTLTSATLAQQQWIRSIASLLPGTPVSTSATFSTANMALLMPLEVVTASQSIIGILVRVVTQSGNYDIGIYSTTDNSTFTRVASKGSTAVPAAASVGLSFSSPVTLTAGTMYYLGFAVDNTTTIFATFTANINPGASAVGYTKTASFPLPSSITGASAMSVSEVQPQFIGKMTGGIAVY